MMDERKPDEAFNIEVDGYTVAAYSLGRGEEVLFCLNGGPGLRCDYVRDVHRAQIQCRAHGFGLLDISLQGPQGDILGAVRALRSRRCDKKDWRRTAFNWL